MLDSLRLGLSLGLRLTTGHSFKGTDGPFLDAVWPAEQIRSRPAEDGVKRQRDCSSGKLIWKVSTLSHYTAPHCTRAQPYVQLVVWYFGSTFLVVWSLQRTEQKCAQCAQFKKRESLCPDAKKAVSRQASKPSLKSTVKERLKRLLAAVEWVQALLFLGGCTAHIRNGRRVAIHRGPVGHRAAAS